MKKKKTTFFIAVSIGFAVFVLWWFGTLQGFENKTIDYRFKLRGAVKPFADIAIVSIDEDSIKHFGRWPWTRSVHAKLIDKLVSSGAKTVVFDVLFTEPDKEHLAADRELGNAIARSKNVVLNCFFQMNRGKAANPLFPINEIANGAQIGFANAFPEIDGVNRKVPVIMDYEAKLYPSLALAGLSVYLGKPFQQILTEASIPLDYNGEMLLNFAGGYETFPYYSFAKVMSGDVPAEKLRGKIILVGGTATALFDLKATPFSPVFPGVEIHANAMSNILRKDFLRPWSAWITFALIVVFSLFTGLALGRIAPLWGGVSAAALFTAYFIVTLILFKANIYAEFTAPALSLGLSFVGVLFFRFMTEEKEKRRIKKTFGQYLNPRVMEKVLSDPSFLKLGGQRETLTVLFSDIRSFTTITESLPPEELVAQLNEYLSKMVEVVFRWDGTLDKFIGDAVMAYWGAPIPQNDHHLKGVLCAIDMHKELKILQDKWRAEGKKVFEIGVGVNSGDMTVGNVGSTGKMDYTVIGDNVNLGARLESETKAYHAKIIISEATYQVVKDVIDAKYLDDVKVK
ncbi:MAG: hypothetical protein A2386_06875, partial [Elusimicrobia bacterium RIFOXYB1_FULL_48_9]